jgi:hypothetical protein
MKLSACRVELNQRVFSIVSLALILWLAVHPPGAGEAQATEVRTQRKALVMGRGDPYREPDGGPTHPQGAKTAFLKLVGNPDNNPAKGWTCDLSWDLVKQWGMDPLNTEAEVIFNYIGSHHLGYRIVIENGPHGHSHPIWDCALDNGLMPFAPQGNNNTGMRFEDPAGLGAAISVAGGSTVNITSYGPGVEFIDAMPLWISHANFEDAAQSWANQYTAAKFAHILDAHPNYNIWDAREHLRQAASYWSSGWTETNGYGRVKEDAPVARLMPAPPIEFKARLANDRHHVVFTWRNFLQSDFAATVIARRDGQVIYQGRSTNATWLADHDGQETFTYWSQNKAGEKSRLETFQTRTVAGLNSGPYQTCLVLGAAWEEEAMNNLLRSRFLEVATNWVCDIAYRPGRAFYDKFSAYPLGPIVAVLPDYSAMVDYAISNHYRIILAPITYAEGDLFRFKNAWDRATAAGLLVVVPHQASISKSRLAKARRLSPPRLSSALTVGEGSTHNERSFGPGLECFDTPAARGAIPTEPAQHDAAAVVAGKLAQILDAYPSYNSWDARQHLRQSSSNYASGWVEDGGYGRPPAHPARIELLDPAPPLEIAAQKSPDAKSVTFSWENFLETGFAETLITRKDGRTIYRGTGTNFVWNSVLNGDETFKFFSKDKSDRLSKSESYTVVRIEGLKAN